MLCANILYMLLGAIANYWELDHQSSSTDLITLANGMAVIQKSGLYFIYAQVGCYIERRIWFLNCPPPIKFRQKLGEIRAKTWDYFLAKP